MALTSTAADVRDLLLVDVFDPDQTRYPDTDLLGYFNEALEEVSYEVAKWNKDFGVASDDLEFHEAAGVRPYAADLPTNFAEIGTDEHRRPRVFLRRTDGSTVYSTRLKEAQLSQIDSWGAETADDVGTPTQFYLRDGQMLVHPRPDEDCEVRAYYYPVETIDAMDEVLPWRGRLNGAIQQHVAYNCFVASEMFPMAQTALSKFRGEMRKVRVLALGRRGLSMSPGQGGIG